MAYVHANR